MRILLHSFFVFLIKVFLEMITRLRDGYMYLMNLPCFELLLYWEAIANKPPGHDQVPKPTQPSHPSLDRHKNTSIICLMWVPGL